MKRLAERIIALTGSRSRIVHRPLPQDDPMQRCPDISARAAIARLGAARRARLRPRQDDRLLRPASRHAQERPQAPRARPRSRLRLSETRIRRKPRLHLRGSAGEGTHLRLEDADMRLARGGEALADARQMSAIADGGERAQAVRRLASGEQHAEPVAVQELEPRIVARAARPTISTRRIRARAHWCRGTARRCAATASGAIARNRASPPHRCAARRYAADRPCRPACSRARRRSVARTIVEKPAYCASWKRRKSSNTSSP